MIPEAAVEAAAKAEYEHEMSAIEGTWQDASKEARALFRQSARVALKAALPALERTARAAAWDEGHAHYGRYFSPNFPEFGVNPYK